MYEDFDYFSLVVIGVEAESRPKRPRWGNVFSRILKIANVLVFCFLTSWSETAALCNMREYPCGHLLLGS